MNFAGDLVSVDFNINDSSGAAVNADSTPTVKVVRDGVDTAIGVTVVNKEIGVYNASFTLPNDAKNGNVFQLRINATISGQVSKGIIYQEIIGGAYSELLLNLDFITQENNGTAVDADSLPTAVFARNAVDDPAVVTVVNKETGVYTATGRIPVGFKEGDEIQVRVTATVSSVVGKDNILLTTLVTPPSLIPTEFLAYADLIFAEKYFTRKLHTLAWDEASDNQRKASLLEAALRIDRLNFRGTKTDTTQKLEWPRKNTKFDDDIIPEDIKIANVEVAFALLDGVDPDLEHENLAAVAEGASSMRTTYSRASVPEHFAAGIPSFTAWTYLRPHLADVRRIKLRRV